VGHHLTKNHTNAEIGIITAGYMKKVYDLKTVAGVANRGVRITGTSIPQLRYRPGAEAASRKWIRASPTPMPHPIPTVQGIYFASSPSEELRSKNLDPITATVTTVAAKFKQKRIPQKQSWHVFSALPFWGKACGSNDARFSPIPGESPGGGSSISVNSRGWADGGR
jgi:hypothetical protein